MTTATSPYLALGGADGLQALVDRFYDVMDELPEAEIVRRLHPESLLDSRRNLFEFLSGWFGGPSLYIAKKGHPRMRMRHNHVTIGPGERDAWLRCMEIALQERVGDEHLRAGVMRAFADMANHLINT